MRITYDEANKMVVEDEDISRQFEEFLRGREKEPHEWDSADLGEFFQELGYETVN